MLRKDVAICNKLGLHARAAAKFVTLAAKFHSDVQLARGSHQVNGKSIMGVMMLAAAKGCHVEITVSGMDEEEAIRQLEDLIDRRFGEAQ